jgi:hypothetical protein
MTSLVRASGCPRYLPIIAVAVVWLQFPDDVENLKIG